MSNPVFVVNTVASKDEKIVIRFFESSAASFDHENKVFAMASEQGLGPKLIETDGTSYRIEEFIDGDHYTHK